MSRANVGQQLFWRPQRSAAIRREAGAATYSQRWEAGGVPMRASMAMAWVVTVDIFSCARVTPASSQREPTIRRGGGGAGGRDRGAQPRGFGCSSRSYAGAGTHSVGVVLPRLLLVVFCLALRAFLKHGAAPAESRPSASHGETGPSDRTRLSVSMRSTRLSTSSSRWPPHDTREFSVSVSVISLKVDNHSFFCWPHRINQLHWHFPMS
jgi:hypothetical protein